MTGSRGASPGRVRGTHRRWWIGAVLLLATAIALAAQRGGATSDAVTPLRHLRVSGATATSVRLSWSAASGADGYRVWRKERWGSDWRLVSELHGAGATRVTDADLVAATAYTYFVTAFGAASHSASERVTATTASAPQPGLHAAADRAVRQVFSRRSAFNQAIPASPVLDRRSARWAAFLAAQTPIANLYEFGVPIYEADAQTPRRRVSVSNAPGWGPDPFHRRPLPLTSAFTPSSGSDAAMSVIDRAAGKVYDFWRYAWNDGRPSAAWGGVASLHGPGNGSGATGAHISRLAGVVRAREIARGRIDHALAFSSDNNCKRRHRWPATSTDGWSTADDCLPEGARVQLDPGIDVAALPGLTPAERSVARALQTYGAVNVDNGGARMALIFETPTDEPDPYPAAGLAWDHYELRHIPWARLRVLRRSNGR